MKGILTEEPEPNIIKVGIQVIAPETSISSIQEQVRENSHRFVFQS